MLMYIFAIKLASDNAKWLKFFDDENFLAKDLSFIGVEKCEFGYVV